MRAAVFACFACSSAPIVYRDIKPDNVIVVERCLAQMPPVAPELTGDAAIDRARRADAYVELERYVRLYAVPSCAP